MFKVRCGDTFTGMPTNNLDHKRFSESDLKDSLDKNNEEDVEENEDNELSEFEKRLEIDYQLRRAFDLVQGVSLFNEIQE